MDSIKTEPKAFPAFSFDSAPEVSVVVDQRGRVVIGGRELGSNHDALRLVHAILAAYKWSVDYAWRYGDSNT